MLMPAAFLGHGSPMNALEHNGYTEAWRAFGVIGAAAPAILVISAHWYINATRRSPPWRRPKTIHDFYGFPDALFAVEYPAPGDPDLAARDRRASSNPPGSASTRTAGASTTAPGRCSCTPSPRPIFPVLQLSINAEQPFDYHLELGAKLAPLRARGRADHGKRQRRPQPAAASTGASPRSGFDWARRFDEAARASHDDRRLPMSSALQDHPDFRRRRADRRSTSSRSSTSPAWPTAAGSTADVLVDGYTYGSLSMTAYTLDAPRRRCIDTAPIHRRGRHSPTPSVVPRRTTRTPRHPGLSLARRRSAAGD